MEWRLAADAPIYSQLAEQMRLSIVSGGYAPGERLPPVRELALSAGVNPNTMQRAMTELEREGLVFPQRTAGRFVTEDAELIAQARREIARVKAEAFLEAMRSLGYTSGEILGLMGSLVKEENGNGQL